MFIFINVFQNIREMERGSPFYTLARLLIFQSILIIFSSIVLCQLEPINWMEAFWQVWQTVTTVGYGNAPATTTLGRLWTMFYGTIGIGTLPVIFTYIFNSIQYYREERKEGRMKNPEKGGYILVNYHDRMTKKYINEIRSEEPDIPICIIDNEISYLPNSISRLGNIWFIKGGGLEKHSYEMSAMTDSKAVLVLPKDNNSDSDGISKAIVSNVLHYVPKSTKVIHILIDQKNSWMFDGYRSVEIFGDLEILAAVQECQAEYSAVITEKLLSNTRGANPHTVKVNLLDGMTWEEFNIKANQEAKKIGVSINVGALVQNDEPMTCPDFDTKIQKGDSISIAWKNYVDWTKLETAIANS